MHTRHQSPVTPLSIVLPHPPLPRCCSSLLSAASSPRTPRTPARSSSILFASNRKSTDSWNSSNGQDDQEWEWKPEQTLLLSRTLDALPAHLVTPFNGPVPPSNLLDKIARGVSQAKGPVDWPHSIRATRIKLIELARSHAKDEQTQHHIAEGFHMDMSEADADDNGHSNYAYYADGVEKGIGVVGSRRPLYRQSSMDFLGVTEIKENEKITCFSDRLQCSDRHMHTTAYHPYSRSTPRKQPRRSSSPPRLNNVPSLINPSTPSSSTLNTLSSFSSSHNILRPLRRSASMLSSSASSVTMSSSSGGALPDPRVQRVRRSDSFYAPTPPPKDKNKFLVSPLKENKNTRSPAAGFKRAPSFGALAQETKRGHDLQVFSGLINGDKDLSLYPSSDEEEKIRSKGVKKVKVKEDWGGSPLLCTPPPVSSAPTSPIVVTAPSSPAVSLAVTPNKTNVKNKSMVVCAEAKGKGGKKPLSSKLRSSTKDRDPEAGSENRALAVDTFMEKGGRRTKKPMNLERNPSMFGAELPHLQTASIRDRAVETGRQKPFLPFRVQNSPLDSHHTTNHSISRSENTPTTIITDSSSPMSTSPQKVKTLRRVRRLAPARRISFGSLVPAEAADGEGEGGEKDKDKERDRERERQLGQLGSAFQLQ